MLKRLALVLALAAAPLTTAQAGVLSAGQAKTTTIGDWHANVYYSVAKGTHRVVITVAPGPGEAGRPLRFVRSLTNGESQEISIGGYGENTALTTLTVTRTGDQVSFNVSTTKVPWHETITAHPAD